MEGSRKAVSWHTLPRHVKIQLWLLLLLPVTVLLVVLAHFFPETVEQVYAETLRPAIMEPFSRLTGYLPFSLAEVIVITAAILAIGLFVMVIIGIVRALRRKESLTLYLLDHGSRITAILLTGVFLFQLLYGLCYHRVNTTKSVYEHHIRYTADDVAWILSYLVDDINGLRREMGLEAEETMSMTMSADEINLAVRQAYESLSQKYPVYAGDYGDPKPVALSEPWTYTFVMGMYFPFTGEANYNTNIPIIELPHTVLHEMAHQRGIADEAEADFAGYLASLSCDDPRVKYSGMYVAVSSLLDALRRMDPEQYQMLISYLDSGFLKEREKVNAFWEKYYSGVADFSHDVNQAYLISNGTVFGVDSYSSFDQYVMDYYVNTYLSEYIAADDESEETSP